MVEVLVIGGGPAGSTAALRLALAGREVLLVERCRFPRLKPCGEFYNPECWRLLRELGLLPTLLAAGARGVPDLVLGCPGGGSLRVPFSDAAGSGDCAFSLGRETLDALLLDAARAAGAAVWEGALVREPARENGMVTGALLEREGRLVEVRARLTLAADGLRSRFARRLGLATSRAPSGRGRRTFGLTARYRAVAGAEERVEMHAGGPGCCGLAVRGAEANLGMVADGALLAGMGGDPARFFREWLGAFPELLRSVAGEPGRVRTVGPLTWRTRRQSVPGCLLLGDAAGFYDPFTGEGVTFALRTAELAARAAVGALDADDVGGRRLAATYDRPRAAYIEPRVLLQKAIQAVIARPALLGRVVGRLRARPDTARRLVRVISDVDPPQGLLTPHFLSRLFL